MKTQTSTARTTCPETMTTRLSAACASKVRLLWAAALALPLFGAQAGVVLTTLHSFAGTDGANPDAALVQGSDGNFYGTTWSGGLTNHIHEPPGNTADIHGYGTVFKISPNGALTSLYSFPAATAFPAGASGLVEGSDGNFYGTTQGNIESPYGGPGTVFKISPSGALTSLYSFTSEDGWYPDAALVEGSDGNFYGTTGQGGTNSAGTVFKISPSGALTSLYSFTGGKDGLWPMAALVQGSDANFYGTTGYGGTNGDGTVFKISPSGALASLYSFTGGNDGAHPDAALVQGSDGYFYGTAGDTVFKISPSGALTSLYSFTGRNDGAGPNGLVQGRDGNFYGTTQNGGTNGRGTAFKISTNGALTTLYAFGSITNASGEALDGANPQAALVQGRDGNFYGTTYLGGTYTNGTVFRLTIVPAAPVLQALTLTNGALGLTWSTEAGGTYQPQCSSDLSWTNWTDLGSAVTATGATLSATDSVTNAPRRFYRVMLSP